MTIRYATMLPNRNNALLSNSNIEEGESIGHAGPPGMAHTAIATTSCVALNCVGTQWVDLGHGRACR